jgi:ribonuclease E
VQLRSGGYIVINQTEALVAIDVNSGRATREHHIEDTAVKTNGEAAEEIARQLRLRDLAGLIVIDFIDMDEGRNNRTVERRMKDALKHDRARIQVGHISHFGLLEMSRQRIRTSVLESSTEKCPVCGGSGHVRSVSSVALQLLRAIEETLIKGATHNLIVRTRSEVALYVLNHKRAHLRDLEDRFRITINISADPTVNAQVSYIVDRGELMHTVEAAKAIAAAAPALPVSALEADQDALDTESDAEIDEEEEEAETETPASDEAETSDAMPAETHGEAPRHDGEQHGGRGGERDGGRRRRRGRGRGRGGEGRGGEGRGPRDSAQPFAQNAAPEQHGAHEESGDAAGDDGEGQPPHQGAAPLGPDGEVRRRRRRGRRGGRRNRQGRNGEAPFQGNGNGNGHGAETRETEFQPRGTDFPPVSDEDASGIAPPFEQTQAPTPAHAEAAPMASAPQESLKEAPRRRSTTREAAPFSGASAAPSPSPTLPPPSPVISSTASEEGGTPKRGWWAKKLLGDKS